MRAHVRELNRSASDHYVYFVDKQPVDVMVWVTPTNDSYNPFDDEISARATFRTPTGFVYGYGNVIRKPGGGNFEQLKKKVAEAAMSDLRSRLGGKNMAGSSRRQRTNVQSLVFSRKKFTPAGAVEWARQHGFSHDKEDVTPNTIRLRQESPTHFKSGSLRTKEFGRGVSAIIGHRRTSANRTEGCSEAEETLMSVPVSEYTGREYRVIWLDENGDEYGESGPYVYERPSAELERVVGLFRKYASEDSNIAGMRVAFIDLQPMSDDVSTRSMHEGSPPQTEEHIPPTIVSGA